MSAPLLVLTTELAKLFPGRGVSHPLQPRRKYPLLFHRERVTLHLLAWCGWCGMDKRRLERIFLPRPVLIRSGMLGLSDAAAVLKDISAAGAYVYTLLPLASAEVVELFVTLVDSQGTLHLCFTGTVTRVENGVTSNSVGVAIAFSGFRELDPATATA